MAGKVDRGQGRLADPGGPGSRQPRAHRPPAPGRDAPRRGHRLALARSGLPGAPGGCPLGEHPRGRRSCSSGATTLCRSVAYSRGRAGSVKGSLKPSWRVTPLPGSVVVKVRLRGGAVRDILNTITKWWADGETFGLATVVKTFRSAPRDPGAALAVAPGGEVIGSVSGGCVEGAVYELGTEVSASGDPVLQTYGVSDDDAFAVGLTCGGILDIFVEQVNRETFPELGDIAAAVERGEGRVGARRVIWGDGRGSGSLGSERLDAAVADDARGLLAQGVTGIRRYGADGERLGGELSVFVSSFAPPPRMYVFCAIDSAAAVARVGKFLGYYVTVCDARPVFATKARFPDADEVVVDWPHRFLAGVDVDAR